jgi:hypothetical protein
MVSADLMRKRVQWYLWDSETSSLWEQFFIDSQVSVKIKLISMNISLCLKGYFFLIVGAYCYDLSVPQFLKNWKLILLLFHINLTKMHHIILCFISSSTIKHV